MRELSELDRNRCVELLERNEIGRVGLCTPLGPRVVPVNYLYREESIVFRTTPYSELGTYGRDHEVAFEVDEFDVASKTGSSVLALGKAVPLEDHQELRRLEVEDEPRPWAGGPRYLVMRVLIRELSGRRVGH